MSVTGEILIEIPQGKLKGSKETTLFGDEYYSFQGIPYAKPPVGELRFKNPEPADKWDGIFDASQKEERSCPGSSPFTQKAVKSDEGALLTNVYIKRDPNSITKKLPVMVYIHGGAFVTGSGMKDYAGPDMMMWHDIVLVSFNYRLSVLGFLSLETPECPGNYGLKDQRLLLQWVQQNIAHFGGDPKNVTIFGISAGGASVQYLTLSPSTKGLFKRAISESGSPLNKWAHRKNPRKYAFALGRKLGYGTTNDAELLKFLRTVPADELCKIGETLSAELEGKRPGEGTIQITFTPTVEPEVDGAFLTRFPEEMLKEGIYHDVPMIMGCTDKEMLLSCTTVTKDYSKCDKDEDFEDFVPRNLNLEKGSAFSLEIAREIRKFYFEGKPTLEAIVNVLTDDFFVYGIYRIAKYHLSNPNHNSPLYLYIFTRPGDFAFLKLLNIPLPSISGAPHGEGGSYLLRVAHPGMNQLKKVEPGNAAETVSRKFTETFVNFATTGNPSGEADWEPSELGKLQYLDVGDFLKMKEGFFKERMLFWDEVYDLFTKEQPGKSTPVRNLK